MKKLVMILLFVFFIFGGYFLHKHFQRRNLILAIKDCKIEEVKALIKNNNLLNTDLRTKKHKPLHLASWYGHQDIIDFLLKEGADPALKDNFGRSSLHLVIESQLVEDEKTIEIAKLYIEKGADTKEVDNDGDTLLHEAAWSKKKKCIAFLSKIGVPSVKNKLGKYPSETGIDPETQNYLKSLGY